MLTRPHSLSIDATGACSCASGFYDSSDVDSRNCVRNRRLFHGNCGYSDEGVKLYSFNGVCSAQCADGTFPNAGEHLSSCPRLNLTNLLMLSHWKVHKLSRRSADVHRTLSARLHFLVRPAV